jgi:glycosyltransferase involved in cell wall biosynthesis
MSAKLSVVMITHNEEKNLSRALESAKWADEIIIVDSFSQDRTKEIARKYTNRIFDYKWTGYGPAKQFALQQASGDWIFSLDADEVVTEDLREDILKIIESDQPTDGYYICRISNFLGRWIKHGGWYPDYVMRLFRKGRARFSDSLVHEELILEGRSEKLKGLLLHYTNQDLDHYLDKMNRYTTLSAQELKQKSKPASIADILVHPPAVLIKMYLFKLGFLDGIQGFLLALYSSFHVLTKYAKLWYLNRSDK